MAGKKRGLGASGAVRRRRNPAEDTEPEGRNQQLRRFATFISATYGAEEARVAESGIAATAAGEERT